MVKAGAVRSVRRRGIQSGLILDLSDGYANSQGGNSDQKVRYRRMWKLLGYGDNPAGVITDFSPGVTVDRIRVINWPANYTTLRFVRSAKMSTPNYCYYPRCMVSVLYHAHDIIYSWLRVESNYITLRRNFFNFVYQTEMQLDCNY